MALRRVAATCLLAVGAVLAATACSAASYAPCSPAGDDPVFPYLGNGCIDVQHYTIALAYDAAAGSLAGTTTVDLVTTAPMTEGFSLDLNGMEVTAVRLNGQPTSFSRQGPNLNIEAHTELLPAGARMSVAVDYHGVPGTDLSQTAVAPTWLATPTGHVTMAEPDGASLWFPSNNAPFDTATYTIALTTPQGYTGVSNGLPTSPSTASDGSTTATWSESEPMAAYLAFIAVGKYDVATGRTSQGIPYVNAVEKGLPAADRDYLSHLSTEIGFLQRYLGTYPFGSVGGVIATIPDEEALETQTRPIYSSQLLHDYDAQSTVVHELSHQWLGDLKVLRNWEQIWLNEGFATYMEWLWSETRNGDSAAAHFRTDICPAADPSMVLDGPLGSRPGTGLFDYGVYQGGAMLLQSLRERIGDPTFFTVLKRWTAGTSAPVTSADFQALAEKVSGQDLSVFFNEWLGGGGTATCRPWVAPSSLTATPINTAGKTTLRWGPLDGIGMKAPIDGYHLRVTDTATGKIVAVRTTGSSTYKAAVTNLRRTHSYTVTATAFSPGGDSPAATITGLTGT